MKITFKNGKKEHNKIMINDLMTLEMYMFNIKDCPGNHTIYIMICRRYAGEVETSLMHGGHPKAHMSAIYKVQESILRSHCRLTTLDHIRLCFIVLT
jgi:hypothetical protein